MDKYINMLLIRLSSKYKVSLLIFMNYSEEYGRVTKNYKLTINKKNKKSKLPKEKISYSFTSKRNLIMEMMKWAE